MDGSKPEQTILKMKMMQISIVVMFNHLGLGKG